MEKQYPIHFFLFFSFTFLFATFTSKAQDVHFSQFDQAPLFLNPALCAVTSDMRATVIYKDQWGSIGVPYQTFGFNGEMALLKKPGARHAYMGLGLSVFSDQSGDIELGQREASLTVSGIVPLNAKNIISAGLQGGFSQLSYNPSKLIWPSQYNGYAYDPTLPGETPNTSQSNYADFSAGFNWSYGSNQQLILLGDPFKFDAGFALYHLNAPNVTFYTPTSNQLFIKYVYHANSIISLKGTRVQLMPSCMYLIQGPSTEFTVGSLIRYVFPEESKFTGTFNGAAIAGGLFFRTHDAFIVQTLLEFGKYGLGISYDFTTSALQTATNSRGGLELVLHYRGTSPFLF
jgi:type IX secretion system PorP/SprF family membrane protein